jgi:cardiolipin synthase
VAEPALTKRRLLGLDRSGPPPQATQAGQPLRPWTIPNAIGLLRAALIPAFLAIDYASRSGTDALAATLFAIAGGGDYADGIAARLTGQYSRLGTLLDPFIDRALAVAGVAVCWSYELLPRWALAVLAARELLMLLAGPLWVRRSLELRINWPGRIAIAPVQFGVFLGLCGVRSVGEGFLYSGLALAWIATALYARDGARQLADRRRGPAASGAGGSSRRAAP